MENQIRSGILALIQGLEAGEGAENSLSSLPVFFLAAGSFITTYL